MISLVFEATLKSVVISCSVLSVKCLSLWVPLVHSQRSNEMCSFLGFAVCSGYRPRSLFLCCRNGSTNSYAKLVFLPLIPRISREYVLAVWMHMFLHLNFKQSPPKFTYLIHFNGANLLKGSKEGWIVQYN